MRKKIISIVLTLILISSVAPMAFATEGGGVEARLQNVKQITGYKTGTPEYNCYLFAGRVFTKLFEYDSAPNINYHGDYDSNNHNTMLIARMYTPMSCGITSCGGRDPVSAEAKALTIGKVNIENTRNFLTRALVGDILQGHRGDGVHTMVIQNINYENDIPVSATVYHGNWNSQVTVSTFSVETLVETYSHALSVFRSKNYFLIDSGTSLYFNPQGGNSAFISKFVDGGSQVGALPKTTRAGYTFDGWYTEPSGGLSVSETTVPTDFILNLYARWVPESYTVTFDATGGTASTDTKSVTFNGSYGSLPTAKRDGYSFVGWSTSTTDTDTVKSDTPVAKYSDHRLYAVWESNIYTVDFDPTIDELDSADLDFAFGTPYGELPTPTLAGQLFTGWATDKEGTSVVTAETAVAIADDHTLYATWTPLFAGQIASFTAAGDTESSIALSWSVVSEATGYEIYRSLGTEESTKIATIEDSSVTSYIDNDCVEGMNYCYSVRAYQTTRVTQFSPALISLNAATLVHVPNTPAKFKVGSTAPTFISLSWSAVDGATGYEVMRSTTPDGPFVTIYVTPHNSTTNTACTSATTYYYRIAAINSVGDSVGRSELTEIVEATTKAS